VWRIDLGLKTVVQTVLIWLNTATRDQQHSDFPTSSDLMAVRVNVP